MTKQEALNQLATYDHLVMSSGAAKGICKPFDIEPPAETYYSDAYQFNKDNIPIYGVKGIAAEELAVHLCEKLDIDYIFQFGKGSQLRTCIDSLRKTA